MMPVSMETLMESINNHAQNHLLGDHMSDMSIEGGSEAKQEIEAAKEMVEVATQTAEAALEESPTGYNIQVLGRAPPDANDAVMVSSGTSGSYLVFRIVIAPAPGTTPGQTKKTTSSDSSSTHPANEALLRTIQEVALHLMNIVGGSETANMKDFRSALQRVIVLFWTVYPSRPVAPDDTPVLAGDASVLAGQTIAAVSDTPVPVCDTSVPTWETSVPPRDAAVLTERLSTGNVLKRLQEGTTDIDRLLRSQEGGMHSLYKAVQEAITLRSINLKSEVQQSEVQDALQGEALAQCNKAYSQPLEDLFISMSQLEAIAKLLAGAHKQVIEYRYAGIMLTSSKGTWPSG